MGSSLGVCGNNAQAKEWEAIRLAEEKRSHDLEVKMKSVYQDSVKISKLLLLGAGESGKSTIFKQMEGIYGGGWTEEKRREFTTTVYSNCITSIQTLVHMSSELKKHDATGTEISPNLYEQAEYIKNLDENIEIDERIAELIFAVWWDPGVQRTWVYRSMYYLTDSAGFFLDKIQEIGQRGYIPTEQDVLRCRIRTTGIQEKEFSVDTQDFVIYDVGGQRNERKKWIHCFSNVTAVLFVAALSGYDMVLYEDQDTNRMHEALDLFEEISNSRYFRKTVCILFLNKRDLFYEKIQHVPLTECFPEYDGPPNDYEASIEYMKDEFLSRSRDGGASRNQELGKAVHIHVTCATEKSNVMKVFQASKDAILSGSLDEIGF